MVRHEGQDSLDTNITLHFIHKLSRWSVKLKRSYKVATATLEAKGVTADLTNQRKSLSIKQQGAWTFGWPHLTGTLKVPGRRLRVTGECGFFLVK